jgi:hypothetical protein
VEDRDRRCLVVCVGIMSRFRVFVPARRASLMPDGPMRFLVVVFLIDVKGVIFRPRFAFMFGC